MAIELSDRAVNSMHAEWFKVWNSYFLIDENAIACVKDAIWRWKFGARQVPIYIMQVKYFNEFACRSAP